MKRLLFLSILSLLGILQSFSQEYEYIPFVREGVKWVYVCDNPYLDDVLDMPFGLHYYSFEMKGDVLIGDKYYKPVVLTHYLDKTGQNMEVEIFTPVYLREEEKVVYAIHPDGIWYAQCPVGYCWYVEAPYSGGLPLTATKEEFILYDFNDPMALYNEIVGLGVNDYIGTSMVTVGGHESKCHHYQTCYSTDDVIIEGIGYDGFMGFPLFYFELLTTGQQVAYGFSHVVEDDSIIYKGRKYDPGCCVGIDEVVADRTGRPQDENYYDLMGRPVGKEVPSTPGIYIHNGKKIVVR